MEKHQGIQQRDVLEFAVDAGRILLKNGAEIFRVEETITHICNHYNIADVNTFVLSTGIFVTAEVEGREIYAKVKHIPLSGAHLGIVDGVNHLSREICAGNISLEDAIIRLKEIEERPPKRNYFRIGAAGVGSASFCYLLGGTLIDSVKTLVICMLLYVFVIFAGKAKLSKMVVNTLGGAIITVLAIALCVQDGIVMNANLDKVIIGSILPLVPGVAFVNSIRDIANSDVISGIVRFLDAMLVFVYIAVGVGTVLSGFSNLIGGINI